MNVPQEGSVIAALAEAEREVRRGLTEEWHTIDGAPATDKLTRLQEQLREIHRRVEAGEGFREGDATGLVRWVTDWISNLDDPLVSALVQLERVTRGPI